MDGMDTELSRLVRNIDQMTYGSKEMLASDIGWSVE